MIPARYTPIIDARLWDAYPVKRISMRYTPVRKVREWGTPIRCTFLRCILYERCTPIACTSMVWRGRVMKDDNNNDSSEPWGGEGELDYAVHASVYGKVQASPTSTKREEQRRERCFSYARAGLSSYLYRLYTFCVYLSILGGWCPPYYNRIHAYKDARL